MALNALRTEMVTFTGTPGIEVNGVIIGYKAEYSLRTGTEAKYNAIEGRTSDVASDANHKGQYYIQLGEQLYDGKLRLANSTDPFGRPSRDWEFNGKTIGVYAKRELIRGEYTKEVTGKELYDLLTKPTIEDKDYDFYIYVNGEDRYNAIDGVDGVKRVFNTTQMNKNNKAGVGGTDDGVLTEVYVDSDKKEVTIAIIDTFLARAKTDYNEKQDEVTFNVYGVKRDVDTDGTVYYWEACSRGKGTDQKEPITVYGEDFDIANVKESDSYLVTIAEGEIQTLVPAEILSGVTLSAFGRDDYVVTEGTQYDYSANAQYDVEVLDEYTSSDNNTSNLKDLKYNVYLDKYGYLIGVDLVDDANNYVFITGVDSKTSNLAAKNYDANAIFLDGTMKTITFNSEKSKLNTTSVKARGVKGDNDWALANTWCTYTVNNDGVYTLTQVALPADDAGSASDADGKTVNYKAGDSTVGLRTSSGNSITKIGQYWDQHDGTGVPADTDSASEEINVKRVSLRGSANANNATDYRTEYKYVYGNKNTVYLNTEVKGINVGTPGNRGVISKVTSVTTGVENTNLKVLTEAAAEAQAQTKSTGKNITPDPNGTAYGSYVLYGKDGYVIAAVTVAKDSSATQNLVYVDSSSVKREEDNGGSAKASGDGMWTWYRDAIKDGERVTLTEVGDGLSVLKSLDQYNWYVISYNANGEVIEATHAIDDPDVWDNYCYDDSNLEQVMVDAGSETVLYERAQYSGVDGSDDCGGGHAPADIKSNKGPSLKGNTFYSETDDKTGFFVDDSVKVVIVQTNRNEKTTQFLSGMSALENVVAKLNKHDNSKCAIPGCKDFHYEVSAIIENGRGKVVVINDLHRTGDDGTYVQHGNRKVTFSPVQYKLSNYEFWVNDAQLKEEDFTKVNAREWYFTVDDTDTITIVEKNGTKFDKVGNDYLLDDNDTAATDDDILGDVVEKDVLTFSTNRNMTLPNTLTDAPDTPAGIPEAVPGVKVAITGDDSSAVALKVGYSTSEMPTLAQALQAAQNFLYTTKKYTRIEMTEASTNNYEFKGYNSLGVFDSNTWTLDVANDVIPGFRVNYADHANKLEIEAFNAKSVPSAAANDVVSIANTTYMKYNTGTGADQWKDKAALVVTGDDWKVYTAVDAKVTIDGDPYYGTAGSTTLATLAPNAEGTFIKQSTNAATPVVTYVASSQAIADEYTYETGFIQIKADTTNINTVQVGGEAAEQDGSNNWYVPVDSTVTIKFKNVGNKSIRMIESVSKDAVGNVVDVTDANTTDDLVVTVSDVNVELQVVTKIAKSNFLATVAQGAGTVADISVTWTFNGVEITEDFYVKPETTDKIVATVHFDEDYADQAGTAAAGSAAGADGDELSAGSSNAVGDCMGSVGTATGNTITLSENGVDKGKTVEFTWSGSHITNTASDYVLTLVPGAHD